MSILNILNQYPSEKPKIARCINFTPVKYHVWLAFERPM